MMDPELHEICLAIAGRLKEARLAAGLSIGQAARLLKCERSDVEEIERYYRLIDNAAFVVDLCKLYGVSMAWVKGSRTEADLSQETRDIALKLPEKERAKFLRLLAMMEDT